MNKEELKFYLDGYNAGIEDVVKVLNACVKSIEDIKNKVNNEVKNILENNI